MVRAIQCFCFKCNTPEKFIQAVASRLKLEKLTGNEIKTWSYIDTADKVLQHKGIEIALCEIGQNMKLLYCSDDEGLIAETTGRTTDFTISPRSFSPKLGGYLETKAEHKQLFKLHNLTAKTVEYSNVSSLGAEIAKVWFIDTAKSDQLLGIVLAKRGYLKETEIFINKLINSAIQTGATVASSNLAQITKTDNPIEKPQPFSRSGLTISTGNLSELLGSLLTQLNVEVALYANWTMRGLDPEFLHQFRSTLRRSRLLIEYYEETFGTHKTGSLLPEISFFLSKSSKTRDYDVFRDLLSRLNKSAAPKAELNELIKICETKSRNLYDEIATELSSPRFELLLVRWKHLGLSAQLFHTHNQEISRRKGKYWPSSAMKPDSEIEDHSLAAKAAIIEHFTPVVYGNVRRAQAILNKGHNNTKIHSARKHFRSAKEILQLITLMDTDRQLEQLVEDISDVTQKLGQLHDIKIQNSLLKEIGRSTTITNKSIDYVRNNLNSAKKQLLPQIKQRINAINSTN